MFTVLQTQGSLFTSKSQVRHRGITNLGLVSVGMCKWLCESRVGWVRTRSENCPMVEITQEGCRSPLMTDKRLRVGTASATVSVALGGWRSGPSSNLQQWHLAFPSQEAVFLSKFKQRLSLAFPGAIEIGQSPTQRVLLCWEPMKRKIL